MAKKIKKRKKENPKKRKIVMKKQVKQKPAMMKSDMKKVDKKPQIASILVYLAIVFLVFNGIYALVLKDKLISEVEQQSMQELSDLGIALGTLSTSILVIALIWIVFAVILFFVKMGVEKKKIGWGWLLALSILTLFTGRIESALLGIIASILYAKSK